MTSMPRAGKSLGSGAFFAVGGLLPPLAEHEEEAADDDAQSPVSRTHSLGAGSLDLMVAHRANSNHHESATPSVSSAKSGRDRETDINDTYRNLYATPTRSSSCGDDDDDSRSAQSAESVQSAASAASSVSSVGSLSLGVGTLLPLIIEEEAAAALTGQDEGRNENDRTPPSNNKARHPIGDDICDDICDGMFALEPVPDDAISVLSGHDSVASLPPPQAASTEPLPLSHHGRHDGSNIHVEPIRRGQHHEEDDTSTFISGITFDAGGESPNRRHVHGAAASVADDGTTSHVSCGKSNTRRRKKPKNPFRRRTGRSIGEKNGDNDSHASVLSGFSFGSAVSGRSTRSRMSLSTLGSAKSRMSSFAGRIRKRKQRKDEERSASKDSGVVGGVVEQPTAGSVVHVSSVASATVESYSTTPVSIRFNNSEEGKLAESKGMKTYSPARRGDSAVNTTLPTVESGDEDASSGDEDGSTLGSIISALSVEHITPSRSMIRKKRARRLQKTGRDARKGADDSASVSSSVLDFAPVPFEASGGLPLLALEKSTGNDERKSRIFKSKTSSSVASGSSFGQRGNRKRRTVGDTHGGLVDQAPFLPDGLADRAPAEEIMLRLGIPSETGLAALEDLRALRPLPHVEETLGEGSLAIPIVQVCGVGVPDYESYVRNAVEQFRWRLSTV